MKVPLRDQLAEAELHRDALAKAVLDKPHLLPRLHASEGIVLTLSVRQEFETNGRDTR